MNRRAKVDKYDVAGNILETLPSLLIQRWTAFCTNSNENYLSVQNCHFLKKCKVKNIMKLFSYIILYFDLTLSRLGEQFFLPWRKFKQQGPLISGDLVEDTLSLLADPHIFIWDPQSFLGNYIFNEHPNILYESLVWLEVQWRPQILVGDFHIFSRETQYFYWRPPLCSILKYCICVFLDVYPLNIYCSSNLEYLRAPVYKPL